MVLTESINYHVNHIGAIRINKDRLIDEFNVGIVITSRRFGAYQNVDIFGYSKNIKEVKQKLNEIVKIAEYEYNQYRERKKDRHRTYRYKSNYNNQQQNPKLTTAISHKKYHNPFDALTVDEDLDECNVSNVSNGVYELQDSTKNVKISWADMVDDD
jgi:hypothetical protein